MPLTRTKRNVQKPQVCVQRWPRIVCSSSSSLSTKINQAQHPIRYERTPQRTNYSHTPPMVDGFFFHYYFVVLILHQRPLYPLFLARCVRHTPYYTRTLHNNGRFVIIVTFFQLFSRDLKLLFCARNVTDGVYTH